MHFGLVSNNNRNPGMGVWGSVLLPKYFEIPLLFLPDLLQTHLYNVNTRQM